MNSVEPIYFALGKRLQEERERRGVTQATVAERVDLPRSAISNIEKGKQRLFVHVLLAYADLLKVNPGSLLRDLMPTAPRDVDLGNVTSENPLDEQEANFIRDLLGDPAGAA
ncbi:helix-turn-helix transcriptional regulator (plasmid) [Deinococcus radiomollis]|uniref:helix-turn-helix domain-containing protein n=1 Tax=Deinococcus radiomollis TaxID=468916 RepID=UPI0038917C39